MWFVKLSVQMFQQLFLNKKRDNFVYHNRPLSYSFGSLHWHESHLYTGREGRYPKFNDHDILIVGLKTLGTSIGFVFDGSKRIVLFKLFNQQF